jgi:pre-rRNA-processing protein TSR3
MEWAEHVLREFSYGESFLEINGELLGRYAECEDAEGVKKVESEWLVKLEGEYKESRVGGEDLWKGGNANFKRGTASDQEEGEEIPEQGGERSLGMPPEEDEDEDEYQEYLRHKVLQSRTFANPAPTRIKEDVEPQGDENDSDYQGSDGHEDIVDAVIVEGGAVPSIFIPSTRSGDSLTALFSRTVVSAPKKGLGS